MNCKGIVCIALFFLLVQNLSSQNINGYWYGTGTVNVEGEHNNYMVELKLKQANKTITGKLSYYFRDSLFSLNVDGSFDAATRKLHIKKFPISYYKNTSTKIGVDCPMSADFLLLTSKAATNLKGSFISEDAFKFTCPVISINLAKSNDTLPYVALKEKIIEEKKPVAIVVSKPKIFVERRKDIVQTIEVKEPTVQLEFYDNGTIDYDSISVFVDDVLVQSKTMLGFAPIKLTVPVNTDNDYTYVSMFAENVGQIPPNTAVLILYDGNKRYEIQMESDFNKTATIRLKRKS